MAGGLQPMPRLDTPLVREGSRAVDIPWHQFLISLWQRTGGEFIPVGDQLALQLTGAQVEVIDTTTGAVLGIALTSLSVGGAAVPVAIGASPQVYIATVAGLLVATAQLELSRDGGTTWYLVNTTGGALPLLAGDRARVTFGAPPVITFFPDV